jgi:hypothetical protein
VDFIKPAYSPGCGLSTALKTRAPAEAGAHKLCWRRYRESVTLPVSCLPSSEKRYK